MMQSEAQVKDPVCGMTVNPGTSAGSFEHKGKEYFFCSTHCRKKFQEAPESFVSQPAQFPALEPVRIGSKRPGETQHGEGGSSYICPMHPEVRQENAGSCPKCGMALEPETITPWKRKTEYTCPMHPEIVRDAPGSCPICGMALEPRAISLDEEANPELREMYRRFCVSVVLTIPLFLIGMTEMIRSAGPDRIMPMRTSGWIELTLATPVVLWGAWPFFVRAWQSIANRSLNMFTLIAMGVGVSYLFSVIATVFPGGISTFVSRTRRQCPGLL